MLKQPSWFNFSRNILLRSNDFKVQNANDEWSYGSKFRLKSENRKIFPTLCEIFLNIRELMQHFMITICLLYLICGLQIDTEIDKLSKNFCARYQWRFSQSKCEQCCKDFLIYYYILNIFHFGTMHILRNALEMDGQFKSLNICNKIILGNWKNQSNQQCIRFWAFVT